MAPPPSAVSWRSTGFVSYPSTLHHSLRSHPCCACVLLCPFVSIVSALPSDYSCFNSRPGWTESLLLARVFVLPRLHLLMHERQALSHRWCPMLVDILWVSQWLPLVGLPRSEVIANRSTRWQPAGAEREKLLHETTKNAQQTHVDATWYDSDLSHRF